MSRRYVVAGSASQTFNVFLQDRSSGDGVITLTTDKVKAAYTIGSTGPITTFALVGRNSTAAWTASGTTHGWAEVSSTLAPGLYKLDVPDASIATTPSVTYFIQCSTAGQNFVPVAFEVQVISSVGSDMPSDFILYKGMAQTSVNIGAMLSSVNAKVTSVDSRLTSMDTMLSSVNSKVTSVDTKVSSMNTQVTSILANVTSINTYVTSMNTQVTSILANVTSIDSRLTSMDTMLTSVNSKVTSVDSRLSSMDTMLSSVNAKVTSVDTDIDTALTRLSSLGTHIDTILTRTSPNNIGAAVWDAQTTAYRVLGSFGQTNYVSHRGAAATVTSNSITADSSASTADGTYANHMLHIGTSADNVGQARRIIDHTSLLLTVSPAWAPTPTTPISYYIKPIVPDTTSASGSGLTSTDYENISHAVWDEAMSSHGTAGTFGAAVSSINSKVTSIDAKATSIDSRLTSMDTMLTSVNAKVTSVDSRLSSMDTMLTSVNSKVTSVDTKVSSMNTQVTSILANVTSIDSRLTSMDTMLTSVNSKVSSVDSRLTSMDTMLTSVNAKVTSADANVALIKAETTAIKAKTDSLTFTQAGNVDANIQYVNDVQVQGTGTTVDTWRPV